MGLDVHTYVLAGKAGLRNRMTVPLPPPFTNGVPSMTSLCAGYLVQAANTLKNIPEFQSIPAPLLKPMFDAYFALMSDALRPKTIRVLACDGILTRERTTHLRSVLPHTPSLP